MITRQSPRTCTPRPNHNNAGTAVRGGGLLLRARRPSPPGEPRQSQGRAATAVVAATPNGRLARAKTPLHIPTERSAACLEGDNYVQGLAKRGIARMPGYEDPADAAPAPAVIVEAELRARNVC